MLSLLAGVSVVERADRYAAGYAGKLLAELGADVVRLDRPTGSPPRDVTETVAGASVEDALAYLHASKRAAAWDDGAARLVAGADIVLVDDPLQAAAVGASEDQVVVCCTPFGLTGPYAGRRAYDLNLSAFAGVSWQVGDAAGPPTANPALLGVTQAGLAAAIGALAAMLHRGRTGVGQLVDVGEYECLATVHMAGLYSLYPYGGEATRRNGRRKRGPYPYGILPCKDGWVCLVFLRGRQWSELLKAMGNPPWSSDPRFADRRRVGYELADEMDALITPWLKQHTRAELLELGMERGIPIGPLFHPAELADNPQLAQRQFLAADGMPGLPLIAEDFPASPSDPSPRSAPDGERALSDLRVLDLGRVVAGSVVSQVMADMGADVVKVESRSHLDSAREGVPIVPELTGPTAMDLMPHFHNGNRGKRGITLDLRNPAGKEIFERLLVQSDVLVENFRPGTLSRLGYSAQRLQELRPGLVVVSVTAAGQEGVYARLTGYATQATAMGGLDSLCRNVAGEPVGMVTLNFGDPAAGLFGSLMGLAGVWARRRTGQGTSVDISMIEACAMHLGPLLHAVGGESSSPMEPLDRFGPNGVFRSLGEDRWVTVATRTADDVLRLCDALARPDLRARYEALAGEPMDGGLAEELTGALTSWAAERDDRTAFDQLQQAGVPSAPVLSVGDLFDDPHLRARRNVVEVEQEMLGSLPIYGFPFAMTATPLTVRRRAPNLAEHNVEVLTELGCSSVEIDDLRARGALDEAALAQAPT